jgi:methylmalonyl-CoA/ethylmalonyl-CoA epimerase
MNKIEHIGIAVKDLEKSIPLFELILNTKCYKTELVESEKVMTAFFKTGENKIELLQATSAESVIHKYIEKKGEGTHHIAFDVENIEQEISRLQNLGIEMIHSKPKDGADNKLIAFIHPKSSNGLLIELCEEKK